MKDKNSPNTGIIESEKGNVVFYGDNYRFTFMTSNISELRKSCKVCLNSQEKYLFGKTHDKKIIGIYLGEDTLEVYDVAKLNTCAYMIQRNFSVDIAQYDRICFSGGILNNLFSPSAMEIPIGEKQLEFKDDSVTFDIQENGVDKIIISSIVKGSFNSIENTDVKIELIFDTEQHIGSFLNSYNTFVNIISFMTNRRNIGFDSIVLQKSNTNNPVGYDDIADVFVRLDEPITKKDGFRFATFSDVGDSFINLVKYNFDKDREKLLPELAVIPETDEEVFHITNSLIRSVCSSLELETDLVELTVVNEEKKKIENLVRNIKKLIKEHKKSEERLLDDTYSLISSSMSHWNVTLRQRIEALFEIHRSSIEKIASDGINEEAFSIREFVKYRNNISHGKSSVPNKLICNTTIILRILVFCSFFTRLGLAKEQIDEILTKGFWY